MSDIDKVFSDELADLDRTGLRRFLRATNSRSVGWVQVDGRSVADFSSNDYLGLAGHPALCDAAKKAVEDFGAGAGSARLISGNQSPHIQLEDSLAEFKGAEAALTFSSGYATALGVIPALVGAGDTIVIDKLSHACLVDGARLSGAKLRVFGHNDLDSLEDILKWVDRRRAEGSVGDGSRTLIVTESVFSMDGDLTPLLNLVELKERYGAWLMVDEAHATGLYGENRRGLIEEFGVSERVEVQMGTLGKALGGAGGYVCGSRTLIDLLINKARSFVFSTAPVPASAAAAAAGIALIQGDEGYARCQRLWNVVDLLKNELIRMGWEMPPIRSAIIPLILGDEEEAVEMAAGLLERGALAPAIRYPTVARGAARIRFTGSAAHGQEHLTKLFSALDSWAKRSLA